MTLLLVILIWHFITLGSSVQIIIPTKEETIIDHSVVRVTRHFKLVVVHVFGTVADIVEVKLAEFVALRPIATLVRNEMSISDAVVIAVLFGSFVRTLDLVRVTTFAGRVFFTDVFAAGLQRVVVLIFYLSTGSWFCCSGMFAKLVTFKNVVLFGIRTMKLTFHGPVVDLICGEAETIRVVSAEFVAFFREGGLATAVQVGAVYNLTEVVTRRALILDNESGRVSCGWNRQDKGA